MKSGNVLLKGCLYFWGGLFLLGLLVQVALPLAICGLIGFGAYLAYKHWRYPLLKDRSLEDQIELLKARIRQADKDIQQLEETLSEKGSAAYKSLANQVLIEIQEIHQEANRLKSYIDEAVYTRIDKKVRSVRATIDVQLERLERESLVDIDNKEPEELAPELSQTLANIAADHQAILDKIESSDVGAKEELTAIHSLKMEKFQTILEGYLKIKANPKNYNRAEERLEQAKAAIEQFDLELDQVLRELNETDMRDFDISLRILGKDRKE